ncbi:MAG TPA: PilC/PilY family type IV pilus protein [Noviherbaspirillum sp.]|jgi:type IV pilus assembly protein PilY1|uniref:pilus assembly protein n=1 Tax=Noviherbaspirillum sp. TaxID=1926288 RepID=UPI002F95100F
MNQNTSRLTSAVRPMPLLLFLGALPATALSAVTDLANAPLANGITNANAVKPNIAFVVDDSGSMDEQNMPDSDGTNKTRNCWGWYKYNTLFYNPNETYKPPFKIGGAVYSDGVTRFPDASFTAALKDGYFPNGSHTYAGGATSNSPTNLSQSWNLTTGASTKYYYTYPTSSADINSTTCLNDARYTVVTSADSIAAPGVAAGSAAAKTNYANWYSYYRRRAFLMKAAAGEAFKDLDESKYRVGLFFLNSAESGADNSTGKNNDLKINDYAGSASGTQRYEWYQKLYGGRDGGWTPLRAALSRMGRMYAGQISGWDPVQYSCQQNFTILSTDGYWNTEAEQGSYGPKKINGTDNVGNADGPGVAAVAARATITIGDYSGNGNNNGCYQATGLTVDTGSGTPVVLFNTRVPNSCTTNRDTLGQAIRNAIDSRTGTTGYDADYSNGKVTITAPASLGAFTGSLSLSMDKVSGNRNRSFSTTNFAGGAAATEGALLPFRDDLNISNTLADVAYYYYTTDLRDTVHGNCSNPAGSASPTYTNLCKNNVAGSGKDTSNSQHMTSFTIGLGVSGTIKYESNYETADNIEGVSQYYDIANDTANWPNPNNELAKIDDLWHAAVNGRGTYYSASNAASLKAGIQAALSGIQARKGSSSAAATSNLEPVAGDNNVYVALYRTAKWDGDLAAYSINTESGALSDAPLWSAQTQLDSKVSGAAANSDGRTIKYFNADATNKVKDFTFTNLSDDGHGGHFTEICAKSPAIDQCGNDADDLTTDARRNAANSGENLVNYLRGRNVHEDEATNAEGNRLYRDREHVLGDIVNAVPVYTKKPSFAYDTYDTSYGTFKANNADQVATVFAAANDGMLHAFDAENGNERWAFVPTGVMKNMWRLADRNYGNNHQYYVDGSPTVADICINLAEDPQMCANAASWKTILVGGLNKGGCSYYALDVTDPTNPKGLWEFSHPQLGYTYGNPIVAKRKNGKWVVIFSSGINNYPGNGCGNTGDGNGRVFVVDAHTGALLDDDVIPTYTTGTTPAGTTGTPSGLGKLNAWIEDPAMPIAKRLYGGDMLGNVWRIDFDDNYEPAGKEAVRLAQLKDGSNKLQPITVKPELAVVGAGTPNQPVVMVGTGRYLGNGDVSDTSQQSLYAIKDTLAATGIADVRGGTMLPRTLTETTGATGTMVGRTIRTVSGAAINWATHDGWYLDFNPGNRSPGERVNVDMSLQFNTLTVAANVPAVNACDVGGYAFLYFFDINSGLSMSTAVDGMAGMRLGGNALVAGIKTLRLPGKNVTVVTDSAGNISAEENPPPFGTGSKVYRTTWREIPD